MPTIRTRGRLPHWEADHAIYFVTFRLADSLPHSVLQNFEFERRDIIETARALGRELSSSERTRLLKLFSEKVESQLDSGAGRCDLANPAEASMVAEAIRKFDSLRYHLYAWCVMPNHVHVLFRPLPGHKLSGILHSWKSFSANRANALLRRSGAFWQREYYDHLIRDEEEFYRIAEYVLSNPRKAGLRSWSWVGGELAL